MHARHEVRCHYIFEKAHNVTQDDKKAQPYVTIRGEKVSRQDLTEQQTYLLTQIQNCQEKIKRLTFDIEQMKAALVTFDQQLSSTIQSNKKMG